MKVFERFAENIREYPGKVIWADECGEYTGEYIDRLSGQVYGYLLDKGLTTEKIIMIKLPHSVAIPICEYGIFKAGACCVIVADWASDEQFEFFKKDSGCDFIINTEVWEEILSTPPRSGWEKPDEHDAAYIVYTSSSTGKPKGVVHEYGDFDYMIKDLADYGIVDVSAERLAMFQSFYDVMSYYCCVQIIYCYSFCYISPIGCDPFSNRAKLLCEKYAVNNMGFMPTSENVKKAEEMACFAYVYTGYEPVMGIYSEMLPVISCYGMSECCTELSYFMIDKYYDIAPVGKPIKSRPVYILDVDDNMLEAGEIGEIAFHNPYMREYLNLPELTREAFRGGLFHTGDMGKLLPDGNLLVLGRKKECVYTERGIIVPILIEVELKKLFPGHWFHVSAYRTGKADRICVFHNPDFQCSLDEVTKKLSDELPPQLIPTDLLEITSVPRLFSGKLNYAKLAEIFYAEEEMI